MHKPIKYAEKGVTLLANAGWVVFDRLNQLSQRPSFTPAWADKPLLKTHEKVKPPLGWPRQTDSLCPKCVPEVRQEILDGKKDYKILINEKVGEIKAEIIERDGKILMVKDCPVHGHFEDVMAIDTEFFKHLEETFPGSDMRAHNDEKLHDHGSSTIKYGRGSVLTIDLTNRCNMMCDPCFMDANQVGFVHELGWDDIKTLLDNAVSIKPKRQMSVQFSGGEPTISPYFLDAVRYARKVGFNSVQAATNGIEFAKSPDFARAAAAARSALRVSAVRRRRERRQLPSARRQPVRREAAGHREPAQRRCGHRAGHHDYQRHQQRAGRPCRTVRARQPEEDQLPVVPSRYRLPAATRRSPTSAGMRNATRCLNLAHDVKDQTGIGEPVRDWFPISFMGTFTDSADFMHGPQADWGQLNCGCHPNCGIGMGIMIDKETKESVPVTAFLKAAQLAKDLGRVNDGGRGRKISVLGMALALIRNYDPFQAPTHFKLWDLVQKFDKTFGASGKDYGKVTGDRTQADITKRRSDRWNFLFIAGMWFQDLFNYDFRRTERCIIPYATQEGEISFCAYNTGVGWRNIIEKMHMSATLTKWYDAHGRHEIFAGGKNVDMNTKEHSLVLDPEAVAAGLQTDLDEQGIAKNARQEKIAARDLMKQKAENDRMAALYRQHVLKEEAPVESGIIQIQGLGGKKNGAPVGVG